MNACVLGITVVIFVLLTAGAGEAAAPMAGDLALEPCKYTSGDVEYDAECGTLVVPENRDDPNSRLIDLPVTRVRALGENPSEPIFTLGGGPGESNMRFGSLKGLIDNHDIVMVGYRGVEGSVVLDCPEMTEALLGSEGDLMSDESISNIGDVMTRCAVRLQDEGADLVGYTIPAVVEDIEAARAGLGYERIDLLSQSLGTRVAMIYAWMYPDSLHRSIMISVNPPGHFVWEPDVLDAQIEYDAGLCAQDPECSARTGDLAETMRSVAHNMPDQWQGLPIDPGKVRLITHAALFYRGSAAMVYDAYVAAEGGDPSGLAWMSQMFDAVWPTAAVWGEWILKPRSDFDPERDYIAEMDPPGSILGAPLSLGWAWGQASEWAVASIPVEPREVQPSDVETLLVSGNIDYSCPAQFATDELLPFLSNGKQVILSEFGHTRDVWTLQPEATIRLLTSFYDTGVADDSLYTYQPMDFHVEVGFPDMAKMETED